MLRLYKRGRSKITKNLNIMNIFKQLNQVLMLTQNIGQISQKSRWMNKHHKINVVDVDDVSIGDNNDSYNSDHQLNDVVDDLIGESNRHTHEHEVENLNSEILMKLHRNDLGMILF